MHTQSPLPTLTHLGDISIATFLRDYWQKKPLLVRQAFSNFAPLIEADELAGLALDDDVVSRLVIEDRASGQWQLQHGPLPEDTFSTLPESHWTLLIQHADSLDPNINALLNAFRFIPNWRLDDIMVSYAPDGGGVGPHFDYFDVFLLQGEGCRRWRLGQHCDAGSPLVAGQPMKILSEFDTSEDWLVEPGDLLYIPAQLAHWGEAIGESVTYSIGFRAPSHSDILLEFSQEAAASADEHLRYGDPDLAPQQHCGEIPVAALARFKAILRRYLDDDALLARWIGEYATELKQSVEPLGTPLAGAMLRAGHPFRLHPFARCAFFRYGDSATIFINGHSWSCSHQLAVNLSEYRVIDGTPYSAADQALLGEFADAGLLVAA